MLYNKMRPKTLSEVRGQETAVTILLDSLAKGNLPNSLLFVGTRGTGKTSVARILARQLNCENPLEDGSPCNCCTSCKSILQGDSLDVLEMDAASNNGVDHVRELIEKVQYRPLSKKKVVILDEVHMLSTSAFNALLKIMEEPPTDVVFILCTTELQKVPATIISRCRKITFSSISDEVIVGKLKVINELLALDAEEEALALVAKAAKGSMRDAESIYEAFINAPDGRITAETVRSVLGFTSEECVFAIFDAIVNGEPMSANFAIDDVVSSGGSLQILLEDCFRTLCDIIAVKLGSAVDDLPVSDVCKEKIVEYAFAFDTDRLFEIGNSFKEAYQQRNADMTFVFQSMLVSLACKQSTITELLNRVSLLEERLAACESGRVAVTSVEQSTEYAVEAVAEPCTDEAFVEEVDEMELIDPEYVAAECEVTESEVSAPAAEVVDPVSSPVTMSDAELASLGFVVCSNNPFEEDEPDADMLISDPLTTLPDVQSIEVSAEPSVTEKVVEDTPEEPVKTSVFDDFARLFAGF